MLDSTDIRLLRAVQADAQLTALELGEKLNLSPSQAGRRRQRLEADGTIRAYRAVLDAGRLGLHVEAFIQVAMATHSARNAADFIALTRRREDIVGMWTLTGEADYLLRVYCGGLKDLNDLVQKVLLPHPAVARVQSQIVMERVKPDTPLPVGPQ